MGKSNTRRRNAVTKLNRFLRQRGQLVLSEPVVRAALVQRLERMQVLAGQMEVDDSSSMQLCGPKFYAWEFQNLAWELRFLLNELQI